MPDELREVVWPDTGLRHRYAVCLHGWPDPIGIFRWRWYARYVAFVADGYVVPWSVPR